MRTYFNPAGTEKILVQVGKKITPLEQQVYHSPTGMTWGYMGSGPHDLARSILFDYYRHLRRYGAKRALRYAERQEHLFCMDVVCQLRDGWSFTSETLTQEVRRYPTPAEYLLP